MNSQIGEFVETYIQQIYALQALIISDSDGVHIFNSFSPSFPIEQEKCIQISTMLISTLGQTNGNYRKIGEKKKIDTVNFFYDKFSLHIRPVDNMVITLFMKPNSNMVQAGEISMEVANFFKTLNNAIHHIKNE